MVARQANQALHRTALAPMPERSAGLRAVAMVPTAAGDRHAVRRAGAAGWRGADAAMAPATPEHRVFSRCPVV
jgi:hypothetical protein